MRGKKNFVLLLLLMVAMVYLKAAFTLESVIKVHLIQTWESWGWFHPKGKQRKQAAACPCLSPLGKCVLEDRLGPPGIELATSSCHWDLQAGKGHLIFFSSSSFFSFTSFKSHESRHDTLGAGTGMGNVPIKPNSLIWNTLLSDQVSQLLPHALQQGFWSFPNCRMRIATPSFPPNKLIEIQPTTIFAEDWCWAISNDLADTVY